MNTDKPQPGAAEKTLDPPSSATKLRSVLLLAFGALLILMLVGGIDALLRLRELRDIEQQANNRFVNHAQALSAIVISVHVYDDQLARLVLQDQSENQPQSGGEITRHAAKAHSALRSYPSDCVPREQHFIQEIERELSEQESASSALLALGWQQRTARSRQFVHEQLLPRSLDILQISQQIASLNDEQFAQDSRDLSNQFESLRTKLKSLLFIILAAGLLISLLGILYVLRLEREGRDRYRALADSRIELEKLSARLVDVQEQERRSIARELHDEVGQGLEALLFGLGGLSRMVPADAPAICQQINHLKSVAENSVKTVRDIALLLRPSMLDDLGLIPALEWQAREVSRLGDMEAEVRAEMSSEDLPDEVKICIYRLVQEALNNAKTHASAKNAHVSVVRTANKIRVEVTDDGQGFDSQRTRGMGLLGMAERVKRLGGTLRIDSQPGRGTSVNAELPLPASQSAAS
jgi:signal transduction histidine kinase